MSRQLTDGGDYFGLKRAEATLPSADYFDPARYEAELAKIWYGQWLYLCRADSLAEPSAYRTFKVGSQNVLLVRDEDGELRHVGSSSASANRVRSSGSTGIASGCHRW